MEINDIEPYDIANELYGFFSLTELELGSIQDLRKENREQTVFRCVVSKGDPSGVFKLLNNEYQETGDEFGFYYKIPANHYVIEKNPRYMFPYLTANFFKMKEWTRHIFKIDINQISQQASMFKGVYFAFRVNTILPITMGELNEIVGGFDYRNPNQEMDIIKFDRVYFFGELPNPERNYRFIPHTGSNIVMYKNSELGHVLDVIQTNNPNMCNVNHM